MSKLDENILAYRANDFVEARALAAHLDDAGVNARVVGDFLDGAYGGIRTGSMLGTEVWIAADQLATAEPLLAAWQAEYHPNRTPAEPQKFQFSMKAALIAMTLVALLATAFSTKSEVFAVTANILLVVFILVMTMVAMARKQ